MKVSHDHPAIDPATLTNNDVASVLDNVAIMLEITGANPFRCRAFSNAARAIEELTEDLRALTARGELTSVRGIGKSIAADIEGLLQQGTFELLDDLRKQVPAGVMDMLRISGMGPKKVMLVFRELGIRSIPELEHAGRADVLASLPGFGAKTQTNILAAIGRMRKYQDRFLFSKAYEDALAVYEAVIVLPGVQRHLLGGSIRRRKETIGDVDILVSAGDSQIIMDTFTALPDVATIVARGETKSSVILSSGINVDLRVVKDDEFAFACHYFTGSKAHNTEVRARAKKMGYKLNEYGLFDDEGNPAPCRSEEDLFNTLGLDYIEPELRENTGEIEAAEMHDLPVLLTEKDIKGVFHCHTTYSDGHSTLREMVKAARALGHSFLGIADHSQTAVYANGLTPERVAEQHREIDKLNLEMKPFFTIKGIESDILPDGSLDYSEEVLASFDYVVASIHSVFNLSEAEMTKRIIKAVENPFTTMLGHLTGRVLLSRDGYKLNLQAVIEACAANDVLIEINSYPNRLDLDWRHLRVARDAGVLIAINPDAHHTSDISYFRYGVGIARKGWLRKQDVLNSKTPAQLKKWLDARKKRKKI